jgi:flagellar capping protein FliD
LTDTDKAEILGAINGLGDRIGSLEQKIGSLEQRAGSLEQRIDDLEARMNQQFILVGQRLDRIEGTLHQVARKLLSPGELKELAVPAA